MIHHLVLLNDPSACAGRLAALAGACEAGHALWPVELGSFTALCGPDGVRFGFAGLGSQRPETCVVLGKAGRQREFEWAQFCLEASGLPVQGAGRRALRSDKLADALVFAATGVRQPRTVCAPRTALRRALPRLRDRLGPRVVGKAIGLTGRGVGVALIEGEADLEALLASTPGATQLLVQEYLPGRHDLRVWVVGGRAVSCHRRALVEGEFRSNARFGAVSQPFDPGWEVLSQCERIAAAWGNSVLAVDLLLDEDGPYFLETNTSANFAISPAAKEIAAAILALHPGDASAPAPCAPRLPFVIEDAERVVG
jgi:hypothetical protein